MPAVREERGRRGGRRAAGVEAEAGAVRECEPERAEIPLEADERQAGGAGGRALRRRAGGERVRAGAEADVEEHDRPARGLAQPGVEPRLRDVEPLCLGERPDARVHDLPRRAAAHGERAAAGDDHLVGVAVAAAVTAARVAAHARACACSWRSISASFRRAKAA